MDGSVPVDVAIATSGVYAAVADAADAADEISCRRVRDLRNGAACKNATRPS